MYSPGAQLMRLVPTALVQTGDEELEVEIAS